MDVDWAVFDADWMVFDADLVIDVLWGAIVVSEILELETETEAEVAQFPLVHALEIEDSSILPIFLLAVDYLRIEGIGTRHYKDCAS